MFVFNFANKSDDEVRTIECYWAVLTCSLNV